MYASLMISFLRAWMLLSRKINFTTTPRHWMQKRIF